MRKFLVSLFLFVIPAWGVLMFADYVYSRFAAKSNQYGFEGWYDLMHGNIDADIIIMGSSRAWVHFDPTIIEKVLGKSVYNIGMDGSCLNRQIQKYQLFRIYNRKPRLIIQNIDFLSLNYGTTGYLREAFFPYFWNKSMRNEFLETEPFSFWEKYVPLYRWYHFFSPKILARIILRTSPTLTKGYQGQERPWDGTELKKIDSIRFSVNKKTLAMFDQYVAEAKAEGVEMIFVYSPLFVDVTRKLMNADEMYAQYQEIADKYDIPVLDYSTMQICSDSSFFYNAMHMNKQGAEIFSDSLAHNIERMGIIRNF